MPEVTTLVEYVTDLAAGTVLIVAGIGHDSPRGWIAVWLGISLILWAVIGSNVAAWLATKGEQ